MRRKTKQGQTHLEALHADAVAGLKQAESDRQAAAKRRQRADERVQAAISKVTAARTALKEARADAEANAKAEADAAEAAAKHRVALELFAQALGLQKVEDQEDGTASVDEAAAG